MTTQRKIKVQLKRVDALRVGDTVEPGFGLFTRTGQRLVGPGMSQPDMTAVWGHLAYDVTGSAWMNDVPEMNVPLVCDGDPASQSILHTPLDAYIVLAPEGN